MLGGDEVGLFGIGGLPEEAEDSHPSAFKVLDAEGVPAFGEANVGAARSCRANAPFVDQAFVVKEEANAIIHAEA